MIIHYLPSTDTYYIPSKELYIKRWMFLYADPTYLAYVLGIDDIAIKDRDVLFSMLGREDNDRPPIIEVTFHK